MSNSVEDKMDTETTDATTAKPAADLETLKAAAREVVKEAEESHMNGNGDSSDNGVHENGSSVEGDEEMDTAGEENDNDTGNENDNDTGNENDNDTGGEENENEGENGSSVDEDPLGGGGEDSADNGDPLGGDEESRDETEENGDKEDNENSNDTEDQDPLGGSEIHSDTKKEINGKSDNEKAAKVNGEIDNGDSAENSDAESDGGDDIIIEKDNTTKAKNNTTPKKKKIEEVTLDDAGLRRSSRKKTPTKYAEMEKDYDMAVEEAELIEEIEEIRDDDSDIVEVDAEDPLTTPTTASISITKSTKSSGGAKKPNVVTIDDLKTLQLLATSAKKTIDSQKNANRLDTQAILAGKMGSGVSITPAKPKFNIGAQGMTLGSGVTIKPNTPKIPSSVTITSNSASPATQSVPSPAAVQQEQEDYDPNLTDDTFVVEAPSFIVPYVYEKPAKEEIKAFLEEIKKMRAELEEKEKKEEEEKKKARKEESKKRREARQKRRDDDEDDVSDDSEDEKEEEKVEDKKEKSAEKAEVKKEDEDKKEVKEATEGEEKKEVEAPKPAPPKTAAQLYFDSTLGKFFNELGMNLVQEYVQKDLLHSQKRRALKDKSVAVMHAISSLQKNLDDSEETNAVFHHDMRKCRFCSFRTESRVVMAHHMETPHMRNFVYRCNFCEFETKIPQEVLFHMDSIHGVKGKLERAPYYHQCPQCSFEDNGKGKLTRHRVGCDKRFKPDMNLNPERDWEPPAKIRAIVNRPGYPNLRPGQIPPGVLPGGRHAAATLQPRNLSPAQQRMGMMSAASRNAALANRGRPVGTYKPGFQGVDLRIPQPNLAAQAKLRGLSPQMMSNQQIMAALNQQGLSVLGKNSQGGKAGSPSISITPLPGRNSPAAAKKGTNSPQMKPGQPGGTGKGSFVICEICDGYIKDLEQLRNHMQWIHKVKIHPKMIHNRPPLNCQKCQFRFFTDQGLERHLLGSHGLVTASMQESANKGQDSGRCPVCGKVYQWKLLNHVAKDHNKTLKPAHLSYKCTVCTATFGQYKLFENHVYTAHSGVAKKTDKSKQVASGSGIQKTVNKPSPAPQPKKQPEKAEVIDLDDEEEIDDVEKDDNKKTTEVINLDSSPKKSEAVKRSGDTQAAPQAKKPKVVEKDPLAIDPLEITDEDKANAENDE